MITSPITRPITSRIASAIAGARTASKNLTPLDVLGLAATRRIDLVMMGDSNQLSNQIGFDHGLQYALEQIFDVYATGLAYEGTSAAGLGYNFGRITGTWATTGAPSAIDSLSGIFPNSYGYVADAANYTGNSGLSVINGSNLDVNAALRFHYCYGTFDSGAGEFKFGVRLEQSPYSVIQMVDLESTNTGAVGTQLAYVDIPAATRDKTIAGKWYIGGQTQITGPMTAHFVRAERTDRAAGFSAHTMYSVGGASLYDFADAFINATDESIVFSFTEIRRLQVSAGYTPKIVVYINAGLNDRNETSQPSLGPGEYTDADSAEAYVDNLQALVSRIEDVYSGAGWDISELYWLIVPSHPVSDPDDSELQAYRAASEAWAAARDRAMVFDFSDYITSAEMLSGGYYASGGADKNHLTQSGYEALGSLIAGAI